MYINKALQAWLSYFTPVQTNRIKRDSTNGKEKIIIKGVNLKPGRRIYS
jgi:hypothetical protein